MKTALYSIALLFAVVLHVSGQQITNVPNRNITSLNGKWHFIIDQYEIGYYDYRYFENPNGFFANREPSNKSDLVEYSFAKSECLNVPADWNSQKPELLYYEGTAWYQKSFDYVLPKEKRLFLWFGAVNYKAIVYLNGKRLGEHEGGFTPFSFEITDKVREKGNYIVVYVNNQRRRDGVPTLNTDWWNYGGITRDVLLIEEIKKNLFIRDFSIGLAKGSFENITGWAQLSDSIAGKDVKLGIPELKITTIVKTDASGKAFFNLKAKPHLWSPETPKLYQVSLAFNNHILTDKVGFRSIETKGAEIVLNGNPIFLRGICFHEEMPTRIARANGSDDAKVLLGWAKELGCNFVRLAHYPHNEAMTRMADSLGLLVWSEIPVYWTIQFGNQEVYAKAEKMMSENITRDKNRASIIIWSIGNETPLTEERHKFMKSLAAKVKQLDNTRLVSAALEVRREGDSIYHVDDPLGEALDVVACNEYVGWYDGLPAKTEKITWKTVYNKPFMFSEFGAEAPYGFYGDSLTRWTEDFQDYFYRQQIKMLNKIKFLRGTSPWVLADFRSPRRLLPGIQDGWNKKGLVSEQGLKKKAFYILRDWYSKKEKEWK